LYSRPKARQIRSTPADRDTPNSAEVRRDSSVAHQHATPWSSGAMSVSLIARRAPATGADPPGRASDARRSWLASRIPFLKPLFHASALSTLTLRQQGDSSVHPGE
jgi:hypothetical protein